MPCAGSPPFRLCSACRVSLVVPSQSSCSLTSHPLSGVPRFSWSLLLDLLHWDARTVLFVYMQRLLVESRAIFLFCAQVAHSIVLLLNWEKVLKYKSCFSPRPFFPFPTESQVSYSGPLVHFSEAGQHGQDQARPWQSPASPELRALCLFYNN